MNRRVWCGSLATTAAWVGFVTAQAPPSAAPAGSSPPAATDGPVYVMKTAGQPERRVKVVKSEKLPDGTFLTDVKDLGTGITYTLTNPAVLGTPAGNSAAPAPQPTPVPVNTTGTLPPANTYTPPGTPRPLFGSFPNQPQPVATASPTPANPAPPNGTPRPLFGSFPNQSQASGMRTATGERLVPADSVATTPNPQGLPQARSRKTDPLLAGMSTTPAAMTARTPFTPGVNEPPSLMGKFLGDQPKELPQPRVGTYPPPAQANLGTPPTLLPPPIALAPNPVATAAKPVPPAAKPTPPAPMVVAKAPMADDLAVPSIGPDAKPTAATGIFDSQPAAATESLEKPSVLIPPIDANPGPSRLIPPIPVETPAVVAPPVAAPPAKAPVPTVVLPTPAPPVAVPTPAPAVTLPTPAPAVVLPTPAPAIALPVPAPTAALPPPTTAAPATIEIPVPKFLPLPAVEPAPKPKLAPPPTGFPTPSINPASATEISIPAVVDAPAAVASGALPAEALTMIDGLKNHRRPSYRMESATSLAESQYAQHADVLAALVDGAKNDAAGVVRGHCIKQLATLGYSDATYLKALVSWEGDSEPAVRRAATAARMKLSK